MFLKLIPADRLVRAMDREYKVEWSAQADPLAVSVSLSATLDSFKGQKHEISFGGPVAFRETVSPQQTHEYRFLANELKKPVQELVTGCGWTYKGAAFGKL